MDELLQWAEEWVGASEDDRSRGWGLMSSPSHPLIVVLIYIGLCIALRGRPIRKNPQLLRIAFLVYNATVLGLSIALAIVFAWLVMHQDNSKEGPKCKGTSSASDLMVARMLWIFFLSKIYELFDTFYLLTRGRKGSFLHFYHHSSIIIATWIGVKYVPFFGTATMALINSIVHVFMYLYYNLTAWGVRPHPKYKQLVTLLQIGQFVVTIVWTVTLRGEALDCGFPPWLTLALLAYLLSFLVLFLHFYLQTYIGTNERKSKKAL